MEKIIPKRIFKDNKIIGILMGTKVGNLTVMKNLIKNEKSLSK